MKIQKIFIAIFIISLLAISDCLAKRRSCRECTVIGEPAKTVFDPKYFEPYAPPYNPNYYRYPGYLGYYRYPGYWWYW